MSLKKLIFRYLYEKRINMKKLTWVLFIGFGIFFFFSQLAFCQTENSVLNKAENVVNSYFSMLEAGDTSGILDLLTGLLMKKRQVLLKNNNYGWVLAERYKNAQFFIEDFRIISDNKIAVDTLIILENQEKIRSRFIIIIEKDKALIAEEKSL